MKILVFMLIAMLSMTLTSCEFFDSEPVNPRIIGVGNLQYNAKSLTWHVVVDSTTYTIAKVTIPDNSLRTYDVTQDIDPVEQMLVTLFTANQFTGVQAVAGRKNIEQIEEMYHTNSTFGVILCISLILWVCVMAFFENARSKSKVQTNK